jgi:outer membrane lipoprotein-sorting protein
MVGDVFQVKLVTAVKAVVLAFIMVQAIDLQALEIDPEIEACLRKNAPKNTTIEKVRLTSDTRLYIDDDKEQVLSAKVYWKHNSDGTSNILTLFDEPDDILGSRLLFLEKPSGNEIYLYMPALFKVQRISSNRFSNSLYGMDFSYEDFQFMYNMMTTAVTERKPDETINGVPMYVLSVVPVAGKKSLYETINSYIDKESCVIRKVEFFEPEAKLRKVLTSVPDSIKKINGILVPHKYKMRDIKEDSETELNVISISIDTPVDDSLFDPSLLKEHSGIF